MTADDLRQLLLTSFPYAEIKVNGKDANFSVDIVSPEFENLSKLNRQKKVLSCVKDLITSGDIHAFSVQAFTYEEWGSSLTVL